MSMTIDELKKEAREKSASNHNYINHYYVNGYVEGSEPREKHIAELEEKLKLLSEYVSDLYVLGYSAKKIAELVQAKIAGILGGKENG